MYTIQTNPSGTRSLEISEENLATIEKYGLFRHLIDSNGIVDETVLDKLKLNIRSLIATQEEDSKDLLDLCIDVVYHNNKMCIRDSFVTTSGWKQDKAQLYLITCKVPLLGIVVCNLKYPAYLQ